jgi:iron complex outermembrane receptor protein
MKLLHRAAGLLLILFLAVPTSQAQQTGSLTGTVSDASDGQPLGGANIILTRPGQSGLAGGAAAGMDGQYTISNIQPGNYVVTFRFVGYNESQSTVTIASGQALTLDAALTQGGLDLNTIVITASRQAEKVLDAPASISVLDAREIQQEVVASTVSVLRNVTGVDVAQTGIDRNEVVLRGFNNAFSGSAYVLTDYRHAAVASLGVNLHSIMPNMPIDVERIEVVRGPGSALYGAGVDDGVIHYITKDPFSYPGTTLSVSGGERSSIGAQFRHAGVVGGRLGYKLTGFYSQADDWQYSPNDSTDAIQLDQDAAGVERNYDFNKLNVNGLLQYRLADNVTLSLNGGYSQLDAIVLSGIGTLQSDGFAYTYGQFRLQANRFFAQFYVNKNDAGDSFVYGNGVPVVDEGAQYTAQAQYDFSFANDRVQLILGGDLDMVRPDTKGTILGRNETDDDINEIGGYGQTTIEISPQLDLTLGLRADYNNIVDDMQFSPRAAVVIKPTNEHTFRASFNRAFSSPGTNSNFLDIVAGRTSGITVRGRGAGRGFTWERNPAFEAIAGTDLVASSLNGCFPTTTAACGAKTPVGLPLDAVYSSVYNGLSAIPTANLLGILRQNGILVGVPDNNAIPIVQGLVQLLNPAVTQVSGFSRGVMGIISPTGGPTQFVTELTDIAPLKQTTSQTIEAGYKGLWGGKVLFALDGYYSRKEDFIGPLLVESPLVFVPTLSADLTTALATGIQNNATLAGQLAQLQLTSAAVAGLLTGLAATSLPSIQTPVAIVQAAENAPAVGNVPELMLSYRNFGQVEFWGVDASAQVLATDALTLFGNLSIVSDDFFDNEELGESNTALAVALNAPTFKAKFGGNYLFTNGLGLNLAGRYIEGFPVESGPYVGDVDSYFLLDIGAGYDFGQSVPGLRLDFTIQNILDDLHREFYGAARIGRMGLARLTYSF